MRGAANRKKRPSSTWTRTRASSNGTGKTMRPVVRLAVVERPAVHEGVAAAFGQPSAYNIRVNRAQRLIEAGP
jgi:hypothetical protein